MPSKRKQNSVGTYGLFYYDDQTNSYIEHDISGNLSQTQIQAAAEEFSKEHERCVYICLKSSSGAIIRILSSVGDDEESEDSDYIPSESDMSDSISEMSDIEGDESGNEKDSPTDSETESLEDMDNVDSEDETGSEDGAEEVEASDDERVDESDDQVSDSE